MPTAHVNGTGIYYESHGSETNPSIVFAHGRGGNTLSWWQQVSFFSAKYRCITFDHRGWGKSTTSDFSKYREYFAHDLAALLDNLGIYQTFLVAQSMGGFSCLEFALSHPKRTSGLVLADTTGGISTTGTLAELLKTNPPPDGPNRSLSQSFIQNNPDKSFLYEQINNLNPPREDDGIVSGFRRDDGPNVESFSSWDIPTLLIVGEEDVIFPPAVISEVKKAVPGSRMEIVKGAAHSAHFEQPKIFNKLVDEMFSDVINKRILSNSIS